MATAGPMQRIRVMKAAVMVATQIRNAIVRGELGDGHLLPNEAQLMEQFDVSRPTLREAIRILESERLVEVSRGARGGARVSLPSSEFVARVMGMTLQARRATLEDVYRARLVIEPPAARMAAETRPQEAAAVLRRHVEKEFAIIDDRSQIASAVSEFHRLLVEQSANQTLSLLAAALQGVAEKHLALVHRRQQQREEPPAVQVRRTRRGFRSHGKLVDLIEAGEGEGAERHWEAHMREVSTYWLRELASSGLDVLE
jgi:DNA-binding FadR family transcriptional regulator